MKIFIFAAMMLPFTVSALCESQDGVVNFSDSTLGSEEKKITVREFHGKKKSKQAIFILPPTGGKGLFEDWYAEDLCHSGYSIILVSGWENNEDLAIELDAQHKAMLRSLDVFESLISHYQSLGHEEFGIVGTSLGGVYGATSLGRFKELKAGFFIVVGAPLVKIFTEGKYHLVTKLNRRRMKHFKYDSYEDYFIDLRKILILDPLSYTEELKKKPVFMIIGKRDRDVPYRLQKNLAKKIGAITDFMPGTHRRTIVQAGMNKRQKMVDFFLQHFPLD